MQIFPIKKLKKGKYLGLLSSFFLPVWIRNKSNFIDEEKWKRMMRNPPSMKRNKGTRMTTSQTPNRQSQINGQGCGFSENLFRTTLLVYVIWQFLFIHIFQRGSFIKLKTDVIILCAFKQLNVFCFLRGSKNNTIFYRCHLQLCFISMLNLLIINMGPHFCFVSVSLEMPFL